MPDLIYLNSDMGSVFESQVAALLIALSKANKFSRVILLNGCRDSRDELRVLKCLEGSTVEAFFYKSYPNYPFYNRLERDEIYKALINLKTAEKSIFHIRGELLAGRALNAITKLQKNLDNVIVDVRGVGLEELSLYFKGAFWKKHLKKVNYNLALKQLKRFHKITVVSESLRQYLIKNHNINKDFISVLHCLAGDKFNYNEQKRELTRNLLGVSQQQLLIVFSTGGNAGWQNTMSLKALISDNWKILNLSKVEIDEPTVINRFISYDEVPDYLSAADIAVILRENTIVNKVACPVKFCEYVCSGLPVVCDNGVDLIVDYVQANNQGAIIRNPQEIHSIDLSHLLSENRLARAIKASETFGITAIVQQYLKLYFSRS